MDSLSKALLSRHLEREEAFWLSELGGDLAVSGMPPDYRRPESFSGRAGRASFDLDAVDARRLLAAVGGRRPLAFAFLVAALKVCLSVYGGTEDVIVGTAIHERHAEDAALNKVLALRDRVRPDATLRELLQGVQRTLREAYKNQKFPFGRVLELLGVAAAPGRAPLFDVVALLEGINNPENVSHLEHDVTLVFSVGDERVGCGVEYNADLFRPETFARFARHFGNALRALLSNPDGRVSRVDLLSEDERRELTVGFNDTAREYPAGRNIHELFEEWAARTPERVALIHESSQFTYAELNGRANRLARHLRSLGVGAESRVGVFLERSADAVVSLLAILKAGGAYVPLDPSYPRERLSFMLEDTGARVIVTRDSLAGRLPETGARVVRVDAEDEAVGRQPSENLTPASGPDNLAYVIYTSGSTGVPKGVSVAHRAVVRLVRGANYVELTPDECVLQFAPLAFDASTFELWGALLNGARLAVITAGQPSLEELGRAVRDYKVTTMWLTAGLFHLMVDHRLGDLLGVRQLLAGGDVLSPPHVSRFLSAAPGSRLVNGYGPTENTTFTCCHSMTDDSGVGATVPIGRPVSNTRAYILDAQMRPVPAGAIGELYAAGDGLARGYLNRPGLTAERFVPDPFSDSAGGRLYKTGDLAKWRDDGTVEFLGRADNQVKIRGFRIELGEIEAALRTHADVRDCAVVVRDDAKDEKRLVGYVVPHAHARPSAAELQRHLKQRLPEYMLPTAFVALDSLPLTANGKVDRAALPEPDGARPELDTSFVEARDETEALLAGIWEDMLGLEKVGARDDFFELGGHSLLATRVMMRVQQSFGVEVPLWRMFEEPTVEGLASAVREATLAGPAAPRIEAGPRPDSTPLSYAQQRLWFLDSLAPGTPLYNVYATFRLSRDLDRGALERALNELVRRHESLRTTFPAVMGRPMQQVNAAAPLDLKLNDLSQWPEAEREGQALSLITQEVLRPFDLERGPLVRAALVKKGERDHVLLVTMHHIVADGWSLKVLNRELNALYESFEGGAPSPLEELPIQYADYAVWQRRSLQGEVLDGQLSYWRRQMAGAPTVLELPTDKPRPTSQTFSGARHPFVICEGTNAPLYTRLKELSRGEGATLFITLLACYYALLGRYTGRGDLVVGTPVANRGRAELEGLIGFFANTLALRVRVGAGTSFRELMGLVREAALGAYANQDVPFERLVEELEPGRDLGRTPLFQALFSLEHTQAEESSRAALEMYPLRVDTGTAKVDLALYLLDGEDGLRGALEYSTDLFDAATVERMASHFVTLLSAAVAAPDSRLSELPLLGVEEERLLLREFNDTARDYPREEVIHRLFERQAALRPEATALVWGLEQMSYAELNGRANRLARHLRSLGVGAESRVGVFLERSADAVVSLLAVLKAGGAYVPLDAQYPAERISFMLSDAGVEVLLTREGLLGALPETGARVVCLDAERDEIARQEAEDLSDAPSPENLAYVIYTSGSTGVPKGVSVAHRAVVRLVRGADYVEFTPEDCFMLLAPLAFDASTFELWGALLNGARLAVMPAAQPSLEELGRAVRDYKVTTMWLTAGLFHLMVDEQLEDLAGLRYLLTGGDVVSPSHARRFVGASEDCLLVNGYGPTENTTFTTYYPVRRADDFGTSVPIGRPITNTRVYVLDSHMRPVPAGVHGELYAAGDGLARGYLNRPALTAERFVPDPFSQEPGARLYKTGDLCRLRADGAVEFIGRMDNQVKVRGFRIELGEIEAALSACPKVKESVAVVAGEGADKRIVAYVVESEAGSVGVAELREQLKERLPEYMMPSAFVLLGALPLTANGKVDRGALPEPSEARGQEEGERPAARTGIEEMVCDIWAQVLGVGSVGALDDFFEVGGHSLLATQVIARVRESLGVALEVRSLFESPTAAEFAETVAAALRGGLRKESEPVRRANRKKQPLALSYNQQRLWFLDRLTPGLTLYNVPILYRLRGRLDAGALEKSLNEIVRRHEVLRTRIGLADGSPVQVVDKPKRTRLEVLDLGGVADAGEREAGLKRAAREQWHQPFDLERGPLFRSRLIRLGERDHALAVTLHHIVTDGWSVSVMTRELAALYEAFSSGGASPLEDLPVQYADYALWQRANMRGEVLEAELSYWRRQLAGAPTVLELPTDRQRPGVQSHRGASVALSLDAPLTSRLREFSRREGATAFMITLAAFDVLLHRYTGRADVLVGTPVANRGRAELDGLMGFFANTLAVRAEMGGDPTFRELVARVRESALGAYAHQDVPFERIVEELEPERDLSRTPLFQVMFSLEHSAIKVSEAAGLVISPSVLDTETAKFDLSLGLFEAEGCLRGALEYSTDLFDAATVERMASHFVTLLSAAVAAPDSRLSELPLLGVEEERLLLREFNDTARDYPPGDTIHGLFERQAARTPERVALVHGREQVTYAELNVRANRLARHLRGMGVGPESTVGVLTGRSVGMVVSLLAVMKAGGAYVPLDAKYPAERISFMLEDTAAGVVLTEESARESLPQTSARVVSVDAERDALSSSSGQDLEDVAHSPDNLAYVIYTSGSTGRPKGVAISHASAATFLHWASEVFTDDELSGVLASTSVCFDLSVFELFAPLARGGRVILAENALELPSLHAASQVTLVNTVPSAITELVRVGGLPATVRTVNLAGEPLKNSLAQRVYDQPTVERVYNLYGPSEDTTYSTFTLVERGSDAPVTIGRPVANTRAYILDRHMRPVPLGATGELFLAGEGLARGYLNRPGLTAERFVPDPFSEGPGGRMYRTGDLARHQPDGVIHYLGRIDHQVKLRGFRIELGEIEVALAAHPDVREAVVVVRGDESRGHRLVAYVVTQQGQAAPAERLRDYLRGKLPHYMIPAAFVELEALPLTPNGKVNRAALPEESGARAEPSHAFVVPRTRAEESVAEVWRDVLGVERVGVNDNFFDLGGHSLLMVQTHSRLRELFEGSGLTVIDLFKYPTVASLAKFLSGEDAAQADARAEAAQPQPAREADSNAVAVIGMAARFPGCKSLDEFWLNLKDGVESISVFTREELESAGVAPEALDDPNYVRAGSVVEDADMFDAPFFDFNPREAGITDPQQRLLLECASEALEGAGYDPERYEGRVGVFAGAGLSGYLQNVYADPEVVRSASAYQVVIGNDKDYLPTRISYKLNLRGPSVNVQTACSTSLVAVHVACRSLLGGECEMALAGGISVRASQKSGYHYQEGGINSPDGHCRAFDADARGTVPGNGGGLVLLKRLSKALEDGDTVHAVILGSAVNNDGSAKVGFTAPSVGGQAAVVAEAHASAGVGPETITYVEAHGTGTPLGDPVELAALTQAFGARTRKKGFCAVGSLKTNLGHLDAGAGVAGLLKTVLALKHKLIPPSLHFERPNPAIELEETPFYVNRMAREWVAEGGPRRAGVSSFGIGGTNAHLVLEEAPRAAAAERGGAGPQLLTLSAKTETALERMTDGLVEHLKRNPGLAARDVAYTLQVGRRAFGHRRALVCEDLGEAAAALESRDARRVLNASVEAGHRPVVFMYPGQGSQYVGMGRGLYESQPVFREVVDACAELLRPRLGRDIRDLLYSAGASERELSQTAVAQPALFVVEYALTKLWMSLGVRPDALIGHSIGEYVAACVAGVFSLGDALRVVAERGRLMQSMPGGAMLMVPLAERELRPLMTDALSLAAVNGPALCVVSGAEEAVEGLAGRLSARGVEGQRLHTSHAFHSRMMEPAVGPFVEVLKTVTLRPPSIKYVSNVTGAWATAEQATDPAYWGDHLRRAVRFADGLTELLKGPNAIALEVGPGKGLSRLATECAGDGAGLLALSTLRHARSKENDSAHLLGTLGSLWLAGVTPEWAALHGPERPRRVVLPTYPFERERYFVEPSRPAPRSTRTETETAAPVETARSAAVSAVPPEALTYIPPGVDAPTRDASARPNGSNGHGRREVLQAVISQQLAVSARQLEVMAEQLKLLRNGSAKNGNAGLPKGR